MKTNLPPSVWASIDAALKHVVGRDVAAAIGDDVKAIVDDVVAASQHCLRDTGPDLLGAVAVLEAEMCVALADRLRRFGMPDDEAARFIGRAAYALGFLGTPAPSKQEGGAS